MAMTGQGNFVCLGDLPFSAISLLQVMAPGPFVSAQLPQTTATLGAALEHSDLQADPAGHWRILTALIGALLAQRDLAQAIRYTTDLIQASRRASSPAGEIYAGIQRGIAYILLGLPQLAVEWSAQAHRLAFTLDRADLRLVAGVQHLAMLLVFGDSTLSAAPTISTTILQQVIALGESLAGITGFPVLGAEAATHRAYSAMLLGQIDLADRYSRQAADLLDATAPPILVAYHRLVAARIGLRQGGGPQALDQVQQAWRTFDALGATWLAIRAAELLVDEYASESPAEALAYSQYIIHHDRQTHRHQSQQQLLIFQLRAAPAQGDREVLVEQMHNATLQQQLRAELSAKEAAEASNRAKSTFLAYMSHEFRTPLNAIINFTVFLGKERYGGLNPAQQDFQQRVIANANHMLILINDLLDLSKIEAGHFDLHCETTDLHPILDSTLAMAQGLTREKGLSLTLDVPASLPLVLIDAIRIRQVLLNLLSNAIKFTEYGGITIRACVVGKEIQVEVIDSGIGIKPEDLEAIFQEFRQIATQVAHPNQGTGLGLPICRRIIHQHGGQIWARSSIGAGSTFVFTVPIIDQVSAVLEATTLEPLGAPPLADLLDLQHLARMGDLLTINERLRAFEARYPTFTQQLGALVKNFEDRAITTLIDTLIAQAQRPDQTAS